MNTMTHEGYVATLEIDEAANVVHGRVVNTRATLTFEAQVLADLHQAFADTIADYRAWCGERGVPSHNTPHTLPKTSKQRE